MKQSCPAYLLGTFRFTVDTEAAEELAAARVRFGRLVELASSWGWSLGCAACRFVGLVLVTVALSDDGGSASRDLRLEEVTRFFGRLLLSSSAAFDRGLFFGETLGTEPDSAELAGRLWCFEGIATTGSAGMSVGGEGRARSRPSVVRLLARLAVLTEGARLGGRGIWRRCALVVGPTTGALLDAAGAGFMAAWLRLVAAEGPTSEASNALRRSAMLADEVDFGGNFWVLAMGLRLAALVREPLPEPGFAVVPFCARGGASCRAFPSDGTLSLEVGASGSDD